MTVNISGEKYIIATHELAYGAPQALRDYLEEEDVCQLTFISHPLREGNEHSYVEVGTKGSIRKRRASVKQPGNVILGYFLHVFLSFIWVSF